MADELDALRARLAGLTGPARTRPLIDLSRRLADRYWRTGPGTPAALPYLNETISTLHEAYGYFEPGDVNRAQIAVLQGWMTGTRYTAHGGPEQDLERGIDRLSEAMSFPQLPGQLKLIARVVLGQLLLSRVTRLLQGRDLVRLATTTGVPPEPSADLERAVGYFREVPESPACPAELAAVARSLLAMAEALRTLLTSLGHGAGPAALSGIQQAMAAVQAAQQQLAGGVQQVGMPAMTNLFHLDPAADPLDRPVVVVPGAEPAASTAPRPRREPAPVVPAAELRAAFRDALPGGGSPFGTLAGLLRDGVPAPADETVDDLVALASALLDAPGAGGTDHLLLAAVLFLRGGSGGGGWAGDDGGDDRRAAARSLLTASDTLPGQRADAVGLALRLATLLDEKHPSGELRTALAGRFATVVEALRRCGAETLGYPLPGGEILLLVTASGRFEVAGPDVRLPSRILIAGDRIVPGDRLVSYVRTGAQIVELATRPGRTLTSHPVIVADPRGDRPQATAAAEVLRAALYPTAARPTTVATVREHRRASMLHLDCGVTAGGDLELADGSRLGPRQLAAPDPRTGRSGGLAVLPPIVDGAAPLTNALLATHYSAVIGWRSPLPGHLTAAVTYVLHQHLTGPDHNAASAVRAVPRWMADPHRKPPAGLPGAYEPAARSTELADPAYANALMLFGLS